MKKILLFAALIWAMCANAQIKKIDNAVEGSLWPTETPGIFSLHENSGEYELSAGEQSVMLYTVDEQGTKPYGTFAFEPFNEGYEFYIGMITKNIFTTDGKLVFMLSEYNYRENERRARFVDEDGKEILNCVDGDLKNTYEGDLCKIDGKWYLYVVYRYYDEGVEHTYDNAKFRTIFYQLPGNGELNISYMGPGK